MLPTSPRLLLNPASNGFGAILARATFRAMLMQGSAAIRDSIVKSGVTPTYVRATTATITDQDLKINPVLSGEARWGGFRRVQNLLVSTGLNGGPSPPTGWARLTAGGTESSATSSVYPAHSEITFSATGAREIIALTVNVVAGRQYRSTIYCSAKSGTLADCSLLMVTVAGGNMDQNHQILSSTLVPGQRAATVVTTCTSSGTMTWRIGIGCGSNDTGSVTIAAPQFEDVTGQSNQNPAEYVSVGVLSAPYQGAFVDGVAYFPTLNGNTVTNNVVTEATGPSINGNSNFASLNGVAGNMFSTPDSAANSVTGDIDIRVKTALVDWTPAANSVLLSKLLNVGQYSYDLYIDTSGFPTLRYTSDGTNLVGVASSAALTFTDGTAHWVRVTRSAASGDIYFYTSDDGITWTQLGTVKTSTPSGIFNGTDVLQVGGNASLMTTGKTYRAQIYNGINGTLAVDFNPNSWTSGATWVSATGETWTINGTAKVIAVALGGYLPEPAATQLVTPLASVRNLTDVSWVKTSCTAAQTAVGADGVANKGSTITGTAINWTCLQTLVAAATSRTLSMLVRRRTGTGAIFLLQNATSLDITASLNSTTYTLVQLNANVLNSAFGIGGSVSGDAVDVDFVQFEAGDVTGLVNSRIPDSISVRNADVLTYATTGWLNAAAGTLYAEWYQGSGMAAASRYIAVLDDATANERYILYTNNPTDSLFGVTDGGVSQATITIGVSAGQVEKLIGLWQVNDFMAYANNVAGTPDVSGTLPTVTQLQIGCHTSAAQLGHYVRNVYYLPTRVSNAVAQSLTV